jgi:predicted aspartyl protease
MTVKIYDTILEALVDTGSTCTIIQPSLYSKLAQKYNLSSKEDGHSNLKSADGKPIQTDGIIDLDILIGQHKYRQKTVIADVEVPMVIGLDFLHENKAQLDIIGPSILLQGEKVICKLQKKL